MKNLIAQTILIGHFLLISGNVQALDEHIPRFSINVGNMTTINLSPSKTFGSISSIALKPHPSNSKKYEQVAELSEPESKIESKLPESTGKDLNKCSDNEFGLEFYCEPTWKWHRVQDSILIIISNKPMVTMTIARIDPSIKYLGQVTNTYFKEKSLYQEGFQAERAPFLEGEAIHVKALSHNFPNIRLSDYFFIQNGALYGVLFAVQPKDEWDRYKFNIQKIVQSFRKLDL